MQQKTGWIGLASCCGVLFCLLLQPSESQAKVRYVLDIDGTLVNDHGADAGWRTLWILKRVEQRHTTLQPNPESTVDADGQRVDAPDLLAVSYGEYKALLGSWAKDERMLGDLRPVVLKADPIDRPTALRIIPGMYRVSPDITFRNYRPGKEGRSPLKDDLAAAIKRQEVSRGKLRWQGIAFPLLQYGLSNPHTVDSIVISSSRYHSEQDTEDFLSALRESGWIKHITGQSADGRPLKVRTHYLRDPEALIFGKSLATQKAKTAMDEATQLLTGMQELHQELVTDEAQAKAGVTAQLHTLIVAEDDPRYAGSVSVQLEMLSSDLHYSQKMKFVLLNAGSEDDIAGSRWPWRWTVFDNGFGREALSEEIQLWTGHSSLENCAALLAGTPTPHPRRRSR